MPRVQHIQTNFTSGVLSPRVVGRIDLQQVAQGAQRMENAFPLVQGGAVSRPGTTYHAELKGSAQARLVPFVKNRSTAYVLEFGAGYMRVFKGGAAVPGPYEIATPYTLAQALAMDFAIDSDTGYFSHGAVYPQRLRRFADDSWQLQPAPFSAEPFAEVGARPAAALTLSAATVGAGRTATASAAVFLASDVGRAILAGPGIGVVTGYTSPTVVTVQITAEFAGTAIASQAWSLDASPQTTCTPSATGPVGDSITLTLAAAGFRSAELGAHVRINGGLVRVTSIGSATSATATVIEELTAAIAAPALAWSILPSVWGAADGYPRTVSLHQQRLIYASSKTYPQTVWGSRIAEPLDFTIGVDDDRAYSFTISSDENNDVLWLSTGRDLLALSAGAEYSLRGGIEKPITPTNVTISPQTDHGAAEVRPVQVRKEVVFVQGAGKKLRGFSYRYEIDGYDAPDLLALADHLLDRDPLTGAQLAIVDACYQREPYGLLWAVRSDGKLLSCTLDRLQGVVGWAGPHDVGGFVESVCCVPTVSADVVYLAVRRTVNGVSRRFLESLQMTTDSTQTSAARGMQTDCGVILSGPSSATWAHPQLAGTVVQVLADGNYMGEFTTDGAGQITLPRQATSVQIGLGFNALVLPVTPEVGSGTGTSAGQAMSTSDASVRVIDSGPVWINDQEVSHRSFGTDVLDRPQPVVTGLLEVTTRGWARGVSDVLIERRLPFPLHVAHVIRTITVNAG